MKRPLAVAPTPCASCPYRRDVPAGVWAEEEYRKLAEYSAGTGETCESPCLHLFLCHQTPVIGRETACRGWLTVEQESIAVRLAILDGSVTADQVYAPVSTPLYATGAEAAQAGLAGVARPNTAARRLIDRIVRQRSRKTSRKVPSTRAKK